MLVLALLLCMAPAQPYARGIASWYGEAHAGRPTANGEKFDPRKLTAAHWTLPFNTKVRVCNLRNERCLVVRINDRGPHPRLKREIDVSERAAEILGFKRAGLTEVELWLVPRD